VRRVINLDSEFSFADSPMASEGPDRREFFTCELCLDIYKDPKLLPCHHSFCKECLEELLAKSPGRQFPCPFCKKQTNKPEGGASGFPNNIHILPQDLERARNWELCLAHDKPLEFYCTRCSETLCLNCKLTKHESHPTQDIRQIADKAREMLTQRRLQLRRDKAQEKNVQANVREMFRLQNRIDVALSSNKIVELLTVSREIEMTDGRGSTENVRQLTSFNFESFEVETYQLSTAGSSTDLQTRVSVFKCSAKRISALSKNATVPSDNSRRCQTVIDSARRTSTQSINVNAGTDRGECSQNLRYRPYPTTTQMYQRTASDNSASNQNVVGSEPVPTVVMDVKEAFDSGGGSQSTRVFSFCHINTDPPELFVSYEQCHADVRPPTKTFQERGLLVKNTHGYVGKVSYKAFAKGGWTLASPDTKSTKTFTKSLVAEAYRLDSNTSGKAELYKVTAICPTRNNFWKTKDTLQFCINVRKPRAIDVSENGDYFAVVDEASTSQQSRRVLLYRRPPANPARDANQVVVDAVDVYQPSASPGFQPSDVCFYNLGGQVALLVSDEANDAIHVVGRRLDNSAIFLRNLTNDCPLLKQPTAMTVDVKGRLWVACKGGKIITMQPRL
jgi:hypothetical protein